MKVNLHTHSTSSNGEKPKQILYVDMDGVLVDFDEAIASALMKYNEAIKLDPKDVATIDLLAKG